MELEHGTEEGMCPFTVHTLTSEEYDTTSSETLKAMQQNILMMVERFLQLDIQKNHSLSGEIQNCTSNVFRGSFLMVWVVLVMKDRDINCQMQSTSDTSCCIHDKRFQKDPYFPLIAFNHEQIKDSTTSGFILAKQKVF